MKLANTNIAKSISTGRALILLGTLAAVVTSAACSNKSKAVVSATEPVSASVRPAGLKTVAYNAPQPTPASAGNTSAIAVKIATPKQITYKSRDYGVTFVYPWQYSFITAKRIANDVELQPKFDGDDGQFTLARVEIPKGFYPDTDFERGYFTLSLNQDISEEQCSSALGTGNDGKVKKETINGVEFEWVETEVSGGGSAAKLRDYVSFVNGACYEVELGVKTQNEQGLAREVDHDQVMRRLEGMLKTVNIVNAAEKPATQQVVSSVEKPTAEDQK